MSEGVGHFEVGLKLLENYLFEIDFGEFGNIMTDEPPPMGDGEGPGPAAMLAAAVANCMAASLLFAVRKAKEDPGELTGKVVGTIQRVDGFLRVTDINVTLTLGKSRDQLQSLEKALSRFENYCTVTQSVRHGVNVSAEVFDANGEKLH
jgi:uncharacterized OsmC-like protein